MVDGTSDRIVRKDALVHMLAHGAMASDRFERSVDAIAITGNLGVVMRGEVVRRVSTSRLSRLHGTKILGRRFTNVFLLRERRMALPGASGDDRRRP
jgi:hypothetical protein